MCLNLAESHNRLQYPHLKKRNKSRQSSKCLPEITTGNALSMTEVKNVSRVCDYTTPCNAEGESQGDIITFCSAENVRV